MFGYGIFKDGKSTILKYPVREGNEPMTGRSFHHGICSFVIDDFCFILGRFVQRLRQLVQSKASVTIRQGVVKFLINRTFHFLNN